MYQVRLCVCYGIGGVQSLQEGIVCSNKHTSETMSKVQGGGGKGAVKRCGMGALVLEGIKCPDKHMPGTTPWEGFLNPRLRAYLFLSFCLPGTTTMNGFSGCLCPTPPFPIFPLSHRLATPCPAPSEGFLDPRLKAYLFLSFFSHTHSPHPVPPLWLRRVTCWTARRTSVARWRRLRAASSGLTCP